jgi:23S rRNA pseudouridine1911/1915/1917 synthase
MDDRLFIATEDSKRADSYIASVSDLSRNECAKLLEEGLITVNGKRVSKKQGIKKGDEIYIPEQEPEFLDIQPENIPIDIIYQDEHIAVINKPQGMVVHPAHGNYSGTLVHAILYHIKDLSGINGVIRPGIVHRLDKNTSGLIIIAKNDASHNSLAEQFKSRTCKKCYYAIAEGVFKENNFVIENYIARSKNDRKKMAVYDSEEEGRFSSTEFEVLQQFKDAALIECRLNTGRTHQIRVHLASIGHPCLGDSEYGFKKNRFSLAGQALHSYKLVINHPVSNQEMTFIAPMPEYMEKLLKKLQNS